MSRYSRRQKKKKVYIPYLTTCVLFRTFTALYMYVHNVIILDILNPDFSIIIQEEVDEGDSEFLPKQRRVVQQLPFKNQKLFFENNLGDSILSPAMLWSRSRSCQLKLSFQCMCVFLQTAYTVMVTRQCLWSYVQSS